LTAADPDHGEQMAPVERILGDLGLGVTPRLLVLNKMDLVPPDQREAVLHAEGSPGAIALSARDRHTTGPLLAAVELALWREGRLERRDQITSVA
jgi:GTP-binding protein HflX